ncbi:MAG: 5-bromo-4-chloroindolyl phosphate hydrolysis family protein [Pseudomonadota bacterium]
MAQRFGGKYSPKSQTDGGKSQKPRPVQTVSVDPVGARANLMFLPAIVLLVAGLFKGAIGLALALSGAGILALGAWLLRGGLQAEATFDARKVARRPAMPRKTVAAMLAGTGICIAALAHGNGVIAAALFGLATLGLHLAAFGLDPMSDKGMEGIDTFQQDRVARVVDEAETYLSAMTDALRRAGDRQVMDRMVSFQQTVRQLIRTVEEDPRDLTAARKYLGVYLLGARDASIKFADINARSGDPQARADYLSLLDDLEANFVAKQEKLLQDDQSDLTVEIEVLKDRLDREGVRTDAP